MADDKNIMNDDDFEKLLNDFINSGPDVEKPDNKKQPDNKVRQAEKKAAEFISDSFIEIKPETEEKTENYYPDFTDNSDTEPEEDADFKEVQSALSDAKADFEEQENQPMLGTDESELAQAFINYSSSINNLSRVRLQKEFVPNFKIEMLYPNYKPSTGLVLSDDLVDGWLMLCKMFPQDVGTFPLKSTDEQFLNFAEKLSNQDLQLAVISYVEILIDLEACELSYMAKLLRYQEKHVKRILYEEYLARKERQQKFVTAISKQNFPIDAELLVTNYFRVSQKDVDGAFKALTTNPAIFAPIDFKKLKPRFFGLIKVSPRDGIRMNIKIGNFLKNLRV